MSTGQVLLTLGSLVLLGYISFNIQRMYVSSVENTVDNQMTNDAINLGRDLSEELQSYVYKYSKLTTDFGDMDDPYNPNKRRTDTSQVGEVFHATVELSNEVVLEHGKTGRLATISVYQEFEDSLQRKLQFVTAVTNLD